MLCCEGLLSEMYTLSFGSLIRWIVRCNTYPDAQGSVLCSVFSLIQYLILDCVLLSVLLISILYLVCIWCGYGSVFFKDLDSQECQYLWDNKGIPSGFLERSGFLWSEQRQVTDVQSSNGSK